MIEKELSCWTLKRTHLTYVGTTKVTKTVCVSKNDQSQDFQTKEYSTWGNKRQTLKKKVYW